MVVPLSFARRVIVCAPPISVPADGTAAALPVIAAEFDSAATEADRLCAA